MKAAVYLAPETMEIQEREIREPEADEVIVKVAYCGVCGTDVHIFQGEDGAYAVHPPLVPGHEFSGTIVKVGSDVHHLKVGDHVTVDPNDLCGHCTPCLEAKGHFCENMIGIGTTADGGFEEYTTVHAKQAYKLADDLDLKYAAMTEPLSCCVHGIDLCNIRVGDSVLVMGGGPIGLLMLQLAKMAGASKLILSEPVESKREKALELGATLAVDPLTEDVEAILHDYCENVDCVIECIGNPHTQADAIRFAGHCATVMFFGLSDAKQTLPLAVNDIFRKELKLTSSYINPYTFKRSIELIQNKSIDLDSIIASVQPLEKLPDVLADPSYRREGKVVIKLS